MYKNYLLIALRSFKKDKTNALITLTGLVVSLTCVLLIIGYLNFESSFESGYENSGRIYLVTNHISNKAENYTSVSVPQALGPTLKTEIPEIEAETSFDLNYDQTTFLKNNGEVQKIDELSVDNDFFKIFDFNFIVGNPTAAFQREHSMVLTKNGAKNLFGEIPPLGTKIISTSSITYTVTGIINDLPSNTFFKGDVFINHVRNKEVLDYNSYNSGVSFILLGKKNKIQEVKRKLKGLYKKYEFSDATVNFLPVKGIHLHSSGLQDVPQNFQISDIRYVYAYSCIALLILLIGCFNFINLSIARSLERAKEVGIRKLFGAGKKQLIIQFIGESTLFFILALPFAILLGLLCWPWLQRLLNFDAGYCYLFNWNSSLTFLTVIIIASLICSIYPAFFLARLNPAKTLKGGMINGIQINLGLRKVLIVLQFGLAVIIVICTFVVHAQLNFLNNQNLGFNKENLIELNYQDYGQKEFSFKNELLTNPDILDASLSRFNIGRSYGSIYTGQSPLDSSRGIKVASIIADKDFIKTMEIPIINGAGFATHLFQQPSASTGDSLLKHNNSRPTYISRALLKEYGIKGNPLGQEVKGLGAYIVGEIGDFKGLSLKTENPYLDIVISNQPLRFGYLYLKISGRNTQATLNFIERKWKTFFPKNAFDYSFVDQRIAQLYNTEIRLTQLFNIFSLLAILITCSGLFSLVALIIRKRTKEIGIRKVMGASVKSIFLLICRDFVRLIIFSFIIAMPFAYFILNRWLQQYAYRTKLYWWLFVLAGGITILIALVTISWKSLFAARANPVDSLRDE